ncbi:MAG: divergent polysaccharide deacetylase family protein [Candidatus Omnitrophica bacterium]|nr:divergent polysaccharide deacetylase family protein [Candidatus Omnitrophota bacterium]MDD5027044.1 divergent polysaccharide deacetylase family protein [Candidatus Omnitrophota bacterium]MDD5661846.1 divergent polysaccharide deacetylase family protein [Candidatus Omnitrophota bacterium]
MKKLLIVILVLVILAAVVFIYTGRPRPLEKPRLAIKGKIAIVLDDWGYNLNNLEILEDIRYPLTVAVLPNLKYSGRISEELHNRGFEIILHLPMEPEEKYSLEKNTIKVSLEKDRILHILDKDLASIAYARGISNHMGSKATSDPRIMEIIFKELKRRKLYFLDSYVTSRSICLRLARKLNLTFFKRDIFLDNKGDKEYIKQQIYELKVKSRLRGFAIGIGHDRRATLEVLREVMPLMAREGYKFVFLSEMAQ